MRFAEFKILLESKDNVVVIGDSIAVGIGGASPYAEGGISTVEVLNRVNAFVKSGKAKGATVILSSGASNSAPIELEGGIKKPGNGGLGPVSQQIKVLKDAGATVVLVGTGSKKSIAFPGTTWTGGKKYIVDLTGVNDQLESMASAAGVKFLGPLEQYDPGMHSGNGDGIHPYSGYAKLKQAGASSAPASNTKDKQGQGSKPTDTKAEQISKVSVPTSRRGADVADVQKVLVALGYQLPRHGVDGIRGPETSAAVKQFQEANGLDVDGDPGPDTVKALNNAMQKRGIKIAKSTSADVKTAYAQTYELDDADIKKYGSIPQTKMTMQAKASAEEYLGRTISDDEWDYLLRATAAESSFNVKSYAMVMGSILNRAKDAGKNGIISALMAKNQFQAVTGTAADGHKPSAMFVRGPTADQLKAMSVAAVEYLPRVSREQKNFTATNPAAYGPGTNIAYLDQMRSQKGGSEIAGSAFNTSLV
jgi:hypothetical protein